MNSTWLRSGLERRSLRIAGLIGVGHAVVLLWIRSALSTIATPSFDPYVVWAFVGLTLVGAYATYVYLVGRFVAPGLGVGVCLGWSIVRQQQYAASFDGLAWISLEPISFYTTLWPLPLLVALVLTVLEWGGRKLHPTQSRTVE